MQGRRATGGHIEEHVRDTPRAMEASSALACNAHRVVRRELFSVNICFCSAKLVDLPSRGMFSPVGVVPRVTLFNMLCGRVESQRLGLEACAVCFDDKSWKVIVQARMGKAQNRAINCVVHRTILLFRFDKIVHFMTFVPVSSSFVLVSSSLVLKCSV